MNDETPKLVALDWGTSSMRGWLLDAGGGVRAEYTSAHGIMNLPEGRFAGAYATARAALRAPDGLPGVACGMVGSTSGWRDVPYAECPIDPTMLAEALRDSGTPAGQPAIVPGVRLSGPVPDVMRGEETQIVGALVRHPELAADSVLVMPGTHSKWVRIRDGRIETFRTFLTGELYATLMAHSILGRPARDAADDADGDGPAAFGRGVLAAAASGDGVAPLLFSARSLFVTGAIGGTATADYLSGLLLGDEIRAGVAATRAGGLAAIEAPVVIVGEAALSRRYARAFGLLSLPLPRQVGNTAAAGLFEIATRAGLVGRTQQRGHGPS